jgi:hypothetical protein
MIKEQSEVFYNLEISLHKKEIRNSREKVEALIADDFVEFGKSGDVFNKKDIIDQLEKEVVDLQINISDFIAKELSPEVVLVTYTANMLDDDNATTISTNRSSIWVWRDQRWQMVFHQGTKKQS